jgi:hypothetical protein
VLASRWLAMDYSGLSRKRVLAGRWLAMDYSGLVSRKRVLAGRFLPMYYSSFQASCHSILKNNVKIMRIM